MPSRLTTADVLARADILGPDECWPWHGRLTRGGYGIAGGSRPGGRVYAHRFFYEFFVGQIPTGLDLDHLCRNRKCVNPAHLEPVTRRENLLRGDTIPTAKAAQTHCIHGHAFTPENTEIRANGTRQCRMCRKERDAPKSKQCAATTLMGTLCKRHANLGKDHCRWHLTDAERRDAYRPVRVEDES